MEATEFDLWFRNSVFWFPGMIKWKRPQKLYSIYNVIPFNLKIISSPLKNCVTVLHGYNNRSQRLDQWRWHRVFDCCSFCWAPAHKALGRTLAENCFQGENKRVEGEVSEYTLWYVTRVMHCRSLHKRNTSWSKRLYHCATWKLNFTRWWRKETRSRERRMWSASNWRSWSACWFVWALLWECPTGLWSDLNWPHRDYFLFVWSLVYLH